MRQIILDTETTGLDPRQGNRIIEIGALEMIDRKLTGNSFHEYINPEREMEEGAFAVHGISSESLKDKPLFKAILPKFLEFIQGAELVIHNAPFDVGFLNYEFQWVKKSMGTVAKYCKVFDTLVLAKKMHPGQRNNLDALCKRYGVDNSNRDLHGALLDAELLGFVYLAMTGGQVNLFADELASEKKVGHVDDSVREKKERSNLKVLRASDDELTAHDEVVKKLKEASGLDLWSK
jgi:DNA polymerase III subunit epsilon